MGTYEGLLDAVYLLLDRVEPRVDGEVEGRVRGRVIVERDAIVRGVVHGPAYIGRGVIVERDASVEHYVSVEQGSKIVSGTVTRSIILEDAELDLNKARLVDSVVGSRSIVKSGKEIYGDIRLIVSDYSKAFL